MNNILKDELLNTVLRACLVGAIIFTETAYSVQPVFEGAVVVEFESVSYTYPSTSFKVKRAKKLGIAVESKTEPSARLLAYLAKVPSSC